MSDFDKEAEREKLREKYEQDEEQRAATEQMSELLLKGATMTNAHCSDCGDPIFRYDGQEFCPTCEKPVDRGGNATDGEDAENGAADQQNVEVTKPSDDARVKFGGDDGENAADERTAETADEQVADERTPDQPAPEADAEPTRRAPSLDPDASTSVGDDLPDVQEPTQPPAPTAPQGDASGDVGSSIAAARASLARTAAKFARQAEATDDPTVAVDALEAAHEAAAALDELD